MSFKRTIALTVVAGFFLMIVWAIGSADTYLVVPLTSTNNMEGGRAMGKFLYMMLSTGSWILAVGFSLIARYELKMRGFLRIAGLVKYVIIAVTFEYGVGAIGFTT